MKKVVFVAPYFMDATVRFIEAALQVPDTLVGLVSCDPLSRLSHETRSRLAAHFAVGGIEASELLRGVQVIARHLGGVDRIVGMLEQIQVALGEIRDHLGVRGMGAAAANNFRDKATMKSVLRAAGLPCARHRRVESLSQAGDFASECGFPVIVKPPDGAGAKGIYRCENAEQLLDCLKRIGPSSHNAVVLEEFVVGREHSFDSICLNGKLVWSSISHYSPGPLEVVQEPWIQWCVMIPREEDLPQYRPVKLAAQTALSALGMHSGLSHMEWFLRDDGSFAISEVGARPPGAQFTSLISYAHSFDLYRAWAETVIHDRFDPPQRKFAAGAAYLRGMGDSADSRRVSEIRGLDEVAKTLGNIVVEARIPKPGQLASESYEGDGYVIVRHPKTSVVQQALQQIVSKVHVVLK